MLTRLFLRHRKAPDGFQPVASDRVCAIVSVCGSHSGDVLIVLEVWLIVRRTRG